MKVKLLKALWWLIKNAPVIVEVIKQTRARHPESQVEEVKE